MPGRRSFAILDMEPELQRELARAKGLPGWRGPEGDPIAHLAHTGASPAAMAQELERTCATARRDVCDAWTAVVRDPQHAESRLRSQLRSIDARSSGRAGTIAFAAAYLGNTSLALDALEHFTANASTPTFQNLWYPVLSNVRKDPRFSQIMRDLGLADLWRSTNEWPDFCRPKGSDDFECS
jgi:hypothetical protein